MDSLIPSVSGAVVALLTGAAFGAFFFWGLWWTSQRVLEARAPGLLMGGSFIVRMAVVLGGLWLVTGGRLGETFVYVVGMLIARYFVIGMVRRTGDGGES